MGSALPTWLDEGAGAATCNLLTIGSATAAAVAVNSARSLLLWPTIGAGAVSAAMAGVASALNCNHNPGSPPGGGDIWTGDYWNGNGCYSNIYRTKADGTRQLYARHRVQGFAAVRLNASTVRATWKDDSNGDGTYERSNTADAVSPTYTGFALETDTCSGGGTPTTPAPPTVVYDFDYTDASTSCTYTYKLADSWIASDGYPRFAWYVDGKTTVLRAGCQGGRITGYVWAPTTNNRYTFNPGFDFSLPGGGGGVGGGWRFDPDFGSIADVLLRAMSFNDPGDLYRLVSVCETDQEGEPISRAVEVNIPPGIRDAGASTRVRLEAIVQLLQGLKDFKQPICAPIPPLSFVGRNISVRFRSAEASPYSGGRLRKVFRYRDQSGKDLVLHSEHWEGFHWLSGSWMVISEGLPWGKPRVWAASAEEGKRVLEHAALIAGVDLKDKRHRWIVREVQGQRENPVLRMNVDRSAQGGPWVVERDGPGGIPTGVVQVPAALMSQLDSDQPHL